jgi:hypothetical protein
LNAPRPLDIPTPDGSGQAVHPDVVYVEGGFAGFPYWMACTPYPGGDDRLENPIIRASHDGIVWTLPNGAPDPLVAAPEILTSHHADPDLVYWEGRLYLYFMTTDKARRSTRFSVMSSSDGRSWTDPEPVYQGTWGVSPAVVATEADWYLWYILLDTSAGFGESRLHRRQAAGPSGFGGDLECRLEIPGHVPWHLDVKTTAAGYEALVAAFPAGTDTSRTRLFHATSRDGVTFVPTGSRPLLGPRPLQWDGRMVYRATFVRSPEGFYRIWYSAGSWHRRFGIGLVEGPLDSLCPADQRRPGLRERLGWAGGFAVGAIRHVVRRILPEGVRRRLRSRRGGTS